MLVAEKGWQKQLLQGIIFSSHWLILWFYVPLDTKQVISEMFFSTNLLKNLNKHNKSICICNKIYNIKFTQKN